MPTRLEIVVDSRLRLDPRGLDDDLVAELQDEFTHKNPKHGALKAMSPKWARGEPEFIATWKKTTKKGEVTSLTLPRGGATRVREILAKHEVVPVFRDRRVLVPCTMPAYRGPAPRDYQERQVEAALARTNCVLRAPTGSGKTLTSMVLVSRMATPTMVVVMNAGLFDQWSAVAEKNLGLSKSSIGVVRAGKFRLMPVTLAMNQSLYRLDQGERDAICSYFGAVIFDEVHMAAARTFVENVDWMPCKYRIGISADEKRKDRKEFMVYDQFGPVADEVTAAEVEDAGFTVPVLVRVVPTDFDGSFYRLQENPNFNELLDKLEVDHARSAIAADIAAAEAQAGEQVLVLTQRRGHAQTLRSLITGRGVPCGLLLGGAQDSEEYRRAVAGLADGSMRCAVGTIQAVGTGIDLPAVSRGVIATPIANNKQLFGQVRGRYCRAPDGKTDAILYYLFDQSAVGLQPAKNIRAWSKHNAEIRDGGAWRDLREWLREHRADEDNDALATLGTTIDMLRNLE